MMKYLAAPMIGLTLLFASGCVEPAQDEPAETADLVGETNAELNADVQSELDDIGVQMERLDQRYSNATDDLAESWAETRTEIRESWEGLEADLERLGNSSADEAHELKRQMAEDVEQLTERVETAELESIEDDQQFLMAARDRMSSLEGEFRVLGREAATLAEDARENAGDELEDFRERAEEIGERLNGLADSTAEEISSERSEIAQEIGALAGSARRQLFELRQGLIEG